MFIVKVPGINGLGKTKGCEGAGNAILKVLKEEIFTNESGKPVDFDSLDLEEIHLDNGNLETSNKLIYENSLESFEMHPKVVFLGGDHSISYSITKAFMETMKKEGKKPCLIVFDAHPDLMEPVDNSFPTHEEWLRGLVENGFPPENILLVGVRNSYSKETEYANEKGIKFVPMNFLENDLEGAGDFITEFANGKELYVSLDIDIVDPAFAPSTGYKEPGGVTSRQLIYLIQRLNKVKTLRGIDIVEINSLEDEKRDSLTLKLGAKVLSEII